MANKDAVLLIDLDSILDTRLGTLVRMDADQAAVLLATGYHDRPWDVFPGFDMDKYRDLYNKRDKHTLQLSLMTPMIRMARDFVHRALQQIAKTPFHHEPKIELNTWPYHLSEAESDLLVKTVYTATGKACDVNAVNYSPEDLNPVFLKTRYTIVTMYDPGRWLDTHSKNGNLKKFTCPNVQVMSPAMLKTHKVQTPEEINKLLGEAEQYASPFVGLQFVPMGMFCSVLNPTVGEKSSDGIVSPDAPKDTQGTRA